MIKIKLECIVSAATVRFAAAVSRWTEGVPDEIFDRVRNQWLRRYQAFTVRRFNLFSRGGGDWHAEPHRRLSERRSQS